LVDFGSRRSSLLNPKKKVMRTVIIKSMDGQSTTAFIPENSDEITNQIDKDRKQKLKENLYIGYLIVGTLAFTLGILISIKRINGK